MRDKTPLQSARLFSQLVPSVLVGCASLLAMQGTMAQEEARVVRPQLEEVMVTARKREETLQDVPFSINAKTEEQLRNSGATDLEGLANNVAGITIQNLGPGQSQVAIRGISAGQIARDQPGVKEQVGVYLDESPISLSLFTPDLDFFDMNRIEVLRGPQGTLFGSGSLSGTLRYISNQPDFEDTYGSVEVTGNSVEDGGMGGDIKAMINTPLSETVALRAVAYRTEYAGFMDAVGTNGEVKEDVNDGHREGFRMALTFQPNDQLSITPRVIYQDMEVNGFNHDDDFNHIADLQGIDLKENQQLLVTDEKMTDEFFLFDNKVEYDFGDTVLTSVTSYTDREVLVLRDMSSLVGQLAPLFDPGLNELGAAPMYDRTEVKMLTQELRLSSNTTEALQWVTGVFYSDIERQYSQTLTGDSSWEAVMGTGDLFVSDIPYEYKQIAAFGEVSYDIDELWTVTVGARWYDYEETRTMTVSGPLGPGGTVVTDGKSTSDGISPRVLVSYEATENVQVNAQISQGFRLGGINDPLNLGTCEGDDASIFGGLDSFDDEELTNYEFGLKSTILDGAGTFNVAVFHSEIENLQATVDAGTCSTRLIYNVEEASSTGIEFELVAQLSDNLEIGVTGSLVEAELGSTVVDSVGNVLAGLVDGNEMPTTPKFQMATSATYYFPIGNEWDGYATGVYQYVGERYTQAVDQEAAVSETNRLASYDAVNIRLGGRTEELDIAFFINNLLDEQADLALDRERGGVSRLGHIVSQPRTLGVSLRKEF